MGERLRWLRPYLVLLAVFTAGRWLQGSLGFSYERAHQVFSIVTLTHLAACFYGVFGRRCRADRLGDAALTALTMGLLAQGVIFLATVASYALGLDTYFNHPRALNSEVPLAFGEAVLRRLVGIVGGSFFVVLSGCVGWLLGALLPERSVSTRQS